MDRLLAPEDDSLVLPALRDDLEIVPSAPRRNGAPAWVIFDPSRNRYFEIGRDILDMLSLWRVGTLERLVTRLRQEFGRQVDEDDVKDTVGFLITNSLVRDIPDGNYRNLVDQQNAKKTGLLSKAMHSYLFFKIPLIRPDRFLRFMWPYVAFLFTVRAVRVFAIIGAIGLYFAARQWSQFAATFQYLLSLEGAAYYGISLVIVKSLHELGHAFMATKYGLRVPTIGVAFMVMFPVLYTDTSGAWRLGSRRNRLMIDGAGIMVELALACVATVLWVLLPDGGVRMAVFAIATTSWVSSLFVNLNPLMRFDGYYIVSDALGFQNMQARGFEMARWRMRQLLFATAETAPEVLSVALRRTVVLHAWATWIYRFFLFLGIAVLVYAFFIKIVGIILFAVEILWFILMPMGKEMVRWWQMRSDILRSGRTYVSLSLLGVAIALAIVPWSTRISVPSVLSAERDAKIFTRHKGQIVQVHAKAGQNVKQGDELFELSAPELDIRLEQVQEKAKLLQSRLDRKGSDDRDRALSQVLKSQLVALQKESRGLEKVRSELVIRAPIDGVIAELDRELQPGMWINPSAQLALIVQRGETRVKGYVGETDLYRFGPGSRATFLPENPLQPKISLAVKTISEAAVEELDEPYLALRFGGQIATKEGVPDKLKPVDARYVVTMALLDENSPGGRVSALRGITIIEGKAESLYSRVRRQVLKVLVREMGV